ncbi:MAG: DUF1028 domain-containing protein [Bacteroidetes bacterium]|nr:DUF1028 domain-containing protein [Bacteroidota bacterium]
MTQKIKILLTIGIIFTCGKVFSQDTFSICAVDSATGQVGSAGATCITSQSLSALIISDVHPGVGVVHTQSYWLTANQNYAKQLMNSGVSPQNIIDSLVANDAQNNIAIRQYGVVDLVNGGRSAAYTGINCFDYKNHILGPNYAIQGNILAGQYILDSMQSRFLNTSGTLACKLMAALQGAKVAGADTRCLNYGISSFSAFIRVANPTDPANNLFLNLTVNTYPDSIEPIDSLQSLFNAWGGCTNTGIIENKLQQADVILIPNPATTSLKIKFSKPALAVTIYDSSGKKIEILDVAGKDETQVNITKFSNGHYTIKTLMKDGRMVSDTFIKQ